MNKRLLVVLPHDNFRDKEYGWLIERLAAAGIGYTVVSSHLTAAKGRFGEVVMPDLLLREAILEGYEGIVFIGEESAQEFVGLHEVTKILEYARGHNKMVAAIGHAVSVLLDNHLVAGIKLTGPAQLKVKIEEAGAFYRGKLVEVDHNVITADGSHAVREFAEEIIRWVHDEKNIEGRKFLR